MGSFLFSLGLFPAPKKKRIFLSENAFFLNQLKVPASCDLARPTRLERVLRPLPIAAPGKEIFLRLPHSNPSTRTVTVQLKPAR